jgi:hypothetical protein
VLDGEALFGTFAEVVRTRAEAGETQPAVVRPAQPYCLALSV